MEEITLLQFWDLFKDHILPNLGTVILNLALFAAAGFILWIILCIVGYRRKWFRRHKRFYSIAVKLFYVYWMVICFYFPIQMGLVRGGYLVVKAETGAITKEIYDQSVEQVFTNPQEKQLFVEGLQASAKIAMAGSQSFTDEMVKNIKEKRTGSGLVDKAKNTGTDVMMDLFGEDINKSILYGVMRAGGHEVGIGEQITYPEFSSAMDALLKADANTIENEMLEEMNLTLTGFFYNYYRQVMNNTILVFALLFFVPFIELILYRMWLRRKREAGIDPFMPKPVEVEREF